MADSPLLPTYHKPSIWRYLDRDCLIALCLIVLALVFLHQVKHIELTNYGMMSARVWPQFLLWIWLVLSVFYFIKSWLVALSGNKKSAEVLSQLTPAQALFAFIAYYHNVMLWFVLFGLYVFLMPIFGMLLGGILFVFLSLSLMGQKTWPVLLLHAMVAVLSMLLMWVIFEYVLKVMLPQGLLLNY